MSLENAKYAWIMTRDQSPTLWSHQTGEAFRSVRGAFTEAWTVFVRPALTNFLSRQLHRPLVVGEFGLGAGTNWFFWAIATQYLGLDSKYITIEKDLDAFQFALPRWQSMSGEVREKIKTDLDKMRALYSLTPSQEIDFSLSEPLVFESLDAYLLNSKNVSKCDVWFHDPFGFDVNPEGYSVETLEKCSTLWNPEGCWGGSFACNKKFQESLNKVIGVEARVVESGHELLKRDRLEFYFCSKGAP
jgi:hypothetical protein